MNALSDHDVASLRARLAEWGENPVHAVPILRDYYRGAGSVNLEDLRARLSGTLKARLHAEIPLRQSAVLRASRSKDGTVKLLLGLKGGGAVESVLMPGHRPGIAAGCVSSQIGCGMGCDFCASTKRGLERNLTAGEIVEQFLRLEEEARALGRRLRTIVYMGMGEPLLNLDAVTDSIRRITSPEIGEFPRHKITVSTVGIVPGIDALADADLGVHLALSLHAPDDETRARLVPMNRAYPIAAILDAAKRYQKRSRRVTNIEYCMLAGINDGDDHAARLAELLRGFRAHVNLIPFNAIGAGVSGRLYARPTDERVKSFLAILRALGVVAHPRDTRGDDVNAACGQLRETLASTPNA